jgi:crossover junction endodeoxyribonuclease RuvC
VITFTIGVDPGLTGAIALLRGGEFREVFDIPTMGRGKGSKQQVNCAELARIVRGLPPCPVWIELVGVMPKQGISSGFQFGRAAGALDAVFPALGFPVHYVTPAAWKRTHNLVGTEKDIARTRAIQLFPQAPLARKRDIGRADALLIAAHGARA